MRTLTVVAGEPLSSLSFTGRWLIDPDIERARTPALYTYYGVAVTARGQFAVYEATDDIQIANTLKVYRSLAEASAHGVPLELISRVAVALKLYGGEVRLDI